MLKWLYVLTLICTSKMDDAKFYIQYNKFKMQDD